MFDMKTAGTKSQTHEEHNYRPTHLSGSYCWSPENMGFALVSCVILCFFREKQPIHDAKTTA
jgi:hypothetical protein